MACCLFIIKHLKQWWIGFLGHVCITGPQWVNTLRSRQNGRHFPDDIFKWIFVNENVWISINISLNFVPRGPINNIPTLVRVMAWRRPGDKPLSEPMMVRLPTHICVTRPQWVKHLINSVWSSADKLLTIHLDLIFYIEISLAAGLKLHFQWSDIKKSHTISWHFQC